MGYEHMSKNDLIDLSNGLTSELRKAFDEFERTKKKRDEIDAVIKERLSQPEPPSETEIEHVWTGEGDGKTFYDGKNWQPNLPDDLSIKFKELWEKSPANVPPTEPTEQDKLNNIAIWIITQKDGTLIGKIGVVGSTGWPVCGESDTETYCKEMAENIGVNYLGVFPFGERPQPNAPSTDPTEQDKLNRLRTINLEYSNKKCSQAMSCPEKEYCACSPYQHSPNLVHHPDLFLREFDDRLWICCRSKPHTPAEPEKDEVENSEQSVMKCKNCGLEVTKIPKWKDGECPPQLQHEFRPIAKGGVTEVCPKCNDEGYTKVGTEFRACDCKKGKQWDAMMGSD